MATRVACALACAAAPLLVLLSGTALPFAHAALILGFAACSLALALGYEAAFATYAIFAWAFAAIWLSRTDLLQSEPSARFADAAYLMSAVAVVVAVLGGIIRYRFRRSR